MKILSCIQTVDGEKIIAELTPNEAYLISRAMTAPIKRKVIEMSARLCEVESAIRNAREFNDKFIETFYPGKSKMNPKGHPRKRGKK